MSDRALQICGIRGIPAQHGGFETFAERLAVFLRETGWDVTVYCQVSGVRARREHEWNGVRLVDIAVRGQGALSTMAFDLRAVLESVRRPGLVLTLGYNTALFSSLYRITGKVELMNMDGLEWKRDKWGALAKAWLYLNERAGAILAHHLIADHPAIAARFERIASPEKVTMIPYGADALADQSPDALDSLGLDPRHYVLLIARPEPENSILEIVKAFSRRPRGLVLAVLGNYRPAENAYHAEVVAAASREVKFLGAIYDQRIVSALRYFARLYVHGHRVGGTNPSLVEALGAGSPILAHDNEFNRWVAGEAAEFFRDEEECASKFAYLLEDQERLQCLSRASRERHAREFTWERVLARYEALLLRYA